MRSPLTAIIVDDELASRSRLRSLLSAHPEILVVGEAGSVFEARALLKDLGPEWVFLDMEMPGGTGFELWPWLVKKVRVIMVTAYPDYALRAFEYGAVDYLIKPVDPDRLSIAIERLLERQTGQLGNDSEKIELTHADGGIALISIGDILWIETQQNYTLLHLVHEVKPHLIRRTLLSWEALLPSDQFVKLGRSQIIQLARIKSIRFSSRGETQVRFVGTEKHLLLGRASAIRLKAAIKDEKWEVS
jgi:two-component system LytT family response regulator